MTLFALVRSLKRQHASQVAGFAAVTIAGAVLIGWWGGLPMLSSWGPAFAPAKPRARPCLPARGAAPRQELALCARGWPRGGRHRCARSVSRRFRNQPLARAAGCCARTRGGLVRDDKRDAAGDRARRWLARAQPIRRASLHRNGA